MAPDLKNLAEATAKVLETIPQAYDDLLKPAAQETGKTLALIPQTVNALLVPLRQWIAQRECNFAEIEKLLSQKLANTSPEKIVPPEAYVAVPTIQAIAYSMDSEILKNLYANLLAKAMYSDTKEFVHPSFVEIIKQMAPLDAQILEEIISVKTFPLANLSVSEYDHDIPDKGKFNIHALELPVQSCHYEDITYISFASYSAVKMSLNNLLRLGIVEKRYCLDLKILNKLKSTPFYMEIQSTLHNEVNNSKRKFNENFSCLVLSSLGNSFKDVCVNDL